jgi:uncharacterized membrane protein
MPRTPIEAVSQDAPRSAAVGSAIRVLSLAGATLTTGLVAGVFYAYAVSVNLGLGVQPDASYIATMQAINQKIQNPLFFLSFFGAVLFLLVALAVHLPRPRFGRFWLIALASALYVGGGFLLTVVVNVPLNEELARVVGGAPAGELAREGGLRGPVELLERRADGVLVSGVCRPRGSLPAARGPSLADGFTAVAITYRYTGPHTYELGGVTYSGWNERTSPQHACRVLGCCRGHSLARSAFLVPYRTTGSLVPNRRELSRSVFLFFIGLVSRSSSDTDQLEADEQQEKPGKDDTGGSPSG